MVSSGSSSGKGSSPHFTHVVVDRVQVPAVWDGGPFRLSASSFLISFQCGPLRLLHDSLFYQSVQSEKPIQSMSEIEATVFVKIIMAVTTHHFSISCSLEISIETHSTLRGRG